MTPGQLSNKARAIVVGSGPNGLAGAVRLAEAGCQVTVFESHDSIGGGARSFRDEHGVLHDVCSAAHPLGYASPYLKTLGLERHGLEWAWHEIPTVHPLATDKFAVMHNTVAETAAGLGVDEAAWSRIFTPLVQNVDKILADATGPLVSIPRHPIVLARFGLQSLLSINQTVRRFQTSEAQALFAGNAAHSGIPFTTWLGAGPGLLLAVLAQSSGWPVAVGGSQSIADALAARLLELGGEVECGVQVSNKAQLKGADIVLFDTGPETVLDIAGADLPFWTTRTYRNFRHGIGATKVDFVINGHVPWRSEPARRAGILHLGGSADDMALSELAATKGLHAPAPFVMVGQQYLADPTRSAGSLHPLWTYAHVPIGSTEDMAATVIGRIEQYAPGFRDIVVDVHHRSASEYESYNPNFVGGDIGNGSNIGLRLIARPVLRPNPYATGIPGWYLCSAATPPGGGVHGLGGFHAAEAALRAQ